MFSTAQHKAHSKSSTSSGTSSGTSSSTSSKTSSKRSSSSTSTSTSTSTSSKHNSVSSHPADRVMHADPQVVAAVQQQQEAEHAQTRGIAATAPAAANPNAPSPDVVAEYHRLVAELEAAQANHDHRIREVTHGESDSLPPLAELRDERAHLSAQVRHHKDEQDSLALDIEGQEGAAELYQVAARVQRLEHFAQRSEEYTEKTLPEEIEKTVEEDRHQSNAELCAYIQELQNKRSTALKKVVASQENQGKRSLRYPAPKTSIAETPDPEELKAIEHNQENKDESAVLHEKILKFRSMKTKLQADIAKERADSKKAQESLRTRITAAEVANARDARQCKELNDRNAAVTTNSQLFMDQLNVEHYGIGNAPTTKQLLQDRKERETTPLPTPVERADARHESGASVGSKQSRTNSVSSRQNAGKPPMVALKRTESQQSRDAAIREEVSASRRRDSDVASYQSSRRQSLSKPPLVASKPTASQQNRDNAIREEREREEASVSRNRQRSGSLNSDVRPPSVAAKSTASQRSREGK